MKRKEIQYIADFLNNFDVFFGKLNDYGVFDKEEFQRYAKIVFELSRTELSKDEKYEAAILIWEISYKIQCHLGSHVNPEEYVEIENLEDDDIRQISNILYYTANWFSYSKEIEEKSLTIGSWA